MEFLKRHKLFFITFVVAYVMIVGFYFLVSQGIASYTIGLQMRRYIPCALAVALAVELWKKAGRSFAELLPHAIVAVLWAAVYPLCYWTAYHASVPCIDVRYDQAFAAYIIAFTVCLRLLSNKYFSGFDKSFGKYIFGVLHILFLVIPITQIFYFINYQSPITDAACLAVLQTTPGEAKEFLLLNLGYTGLGGVFLFWLAVLDVMVKLNNLDDRVLLTSFGKKSVCIAVTVVVATVAYGGKSFTRTGVLECYMAAKDYFAKADLFKTYHAGNFAELQVTPDKPAFSKPSTIIMVIGESASRYYMSAYNPNHPNDNAPWLRAMKKNDNFTVFNHAYTSWGQTVPSLERALTEKNQYTNKDFNQSVTVIDIAKKAGYNTYWFSNQGYMGSADTPITLVATTADKGEWLELRRQDGTTYKHDGDLLELLKTVDSAKNNFIVLHFIGSHEDCINRYPAGFTKFGEPGKFDMVLNYDNSIAYTDDVLRQVYEYASANLNLQAMLYFSDHGGDPYRKRHPDQTGFKSLRVPMFVYLSDEYQKLYPEASKTIKAHRNSYFTIDLIYEAVCGLLQVKSSNYDETMGLFSDKYKFTRDTLTTNLGKNKLSDDKDENQNEE